MATFRCVPLLLLFSAFFFLLLLSDRASSSLVAYYSFDGAAPLSALSGNCPNTVPQAILSGNAAVVASGCKFINCTKPGSGYIDTRSLRIFQGLDTSQLSVAAWVRTPSSASSGVIIYKASMLSISYGRPNIFTAWSLYCTFAFNSQQSQTVSIGNSPLSSGSTYYHVACTYDGQKMCLYINGASKTCANFKSVFTESTSNLFIGSDGSNSWGGNIDEVKIYDHALTDANVNDLYNGVGPNDQPTAQILNDGALLSATLTSQALNTLNLTAEVSDAKTAFAGRSQPAGYADSFNYVWDALSSQCGIVDVVDGDGPNSIMNLVQLGTFTINLCVSDGEIANLVTVSTFITPSTPRLTRQPTIPLIRVADGTTFPLSIQALGLPPPSYQWQQLVEVEYNITTNDTLVKREDIQALLEKYDLDEIEELLMREREIVLVEEFHDIPDETEDTLLVNSTAVENGTVYRCLVFSGGGFVVTDNFTIVVVRAPDPSLLPPASSSDDTQVAIIAGVVGGVGGLLLLCCLVLVLAAFTWGWRRGRSPYRRLKQPNYDEIAYGDVTESVVLPKKQLDNLMTLERLLKSPGLRLPQAMLVSANFNDVEQVARSLLRVLEDNDTKGAQLVMEMVTYEVGKASDVGTLFRANSAAVKLFSLYMKMAALRYLWHTLVLSVHSLNDAALEAHGLNEDGEEMVARSGSSQVINSRIGRYKIEMYDDDDADTHASAIDIFGPSTMELDPRKITDLGDLTINTLELWLVAQKLLKFITESEHRMPRELRKIIQRVDEEVDAKFGEVAAYRAMGGFYFLRFICPALMAPQAFGLLEGPPHQVTQRQLILVSKVIQNLANDTLPGAKEEYMQRLNDFIITNKPIVEHFYEEIVKHPNKGAASRVEVPQAAKNAALLHLHQHIVANTAAIEAAVRDGCADASDEERESAEDVINALNYVLKQMGDLDGEGKNITDEDLGNLDL